MSNREHQFHQENNRYSSNVPKLPLATHANILTITIVTETGVRLAVKMRLQCVYQPLSSQTGSLAEFLQLDSGDVFLLFRDHVLRLGLSNPCFRTQSMTNVFL